MHLNKGFKLFLLIALLAAMGSVIYAVFFLKPFIREKFVAALQQSLPPGYVLDYDSLQINIFPFGANFKNLNMTSSKTDTGDGKNNSMEIVIETLKIRHVGIWDYYIHNQLIIDEVKADGISLLRIRAEENNRKDGQDGNGQFPLKKIEIKSMGISNMEIVQQQADQSQKSSLRVPKMNMVVRRVGFDPTIGFLHPEFYELELLSPLYYQKNGLHSIGAKRIWLSSDETDLKIDSFRVTPLIKAFQLARHVEEETDIMDLSVPLITVAEIDIPQWIDSGRFSARGITLDRPRLEIYKDKTLPPKKKRKDFPSEMFKDLQEWLILDSIRIRNGFLKYYEHKNKDAEPGYVTFERLNGEIRGFTSHHSGKSGSTIKASALLMGEGFLQADITFPLGFKTDTFTVKGSLGAMQLDHLNAMTVQAASIEIVKGRSENISFSFQANRWVSSGELHFSYSDLKLSFIEKEKGRKGILRRIISTIANMAVRNSNPKKNDFRVGEIHFVREEPKSIFNYWWKSLFSGIESTVLAKNNRNNNKK